MRVNVYAEEMSDRIEIISKKIEGQNFTGLRFYLELPATTHRLTGSPVTSEDIVDEKDLVQIQAPFIHHPGDDDSSAVTFWGKQDLRKALLEAVVQLDKHYQGKEYAKDWPTLDDLIEDADPNY